MSTPPFAQPLSYYQDLLTSEYRANVAPNMNAWLTANLNLFQDAAACLRSMLTAFDLNTAVGVQLDVVGSLVGRSRTLPFQPTPYVNSIATLDGYDGEGIIFDGTYVWEASEGNNVVLKRDPLTGSILGSVAIPNSPISLAYDGTNIWVGLNAGDITRFVAATGVIVGSPFASGLSSAPQMIFNGTSLLVIGQAGGFSAIKEIDVSSGSVIHSVGFGGNAAGLIYDGTNPWVTDPTGFINKCDMAGGTYTQYTLGGAPFGIAFDGTYMWITNDSLGLQKVDLTGTVVNTYAPPAAFNSSRLASIPGFFWIVNRDTAFFLFDVNATTFQQFANSSIGLFSDLCTVGDNAWCTCFSGFEGLTELIYNRTPTPVLDDDNYRFLLLATVFHNHWNGQVDSFQDFWSMLFPGGQLTIDDHQNMTADIILQGQFTQIVQDMITNGLIVPRPQGVLYTYIFPDLPMFGFDENTRFIAGLDLGKFV